MAIVHPSAVVDSSAELAGEVTIGPFCVVGPDVVLHDGVVLKSHVVVEGHTSIGEGTIVHPFAALGGQPQNFRHKGGRTTLTIGARNVIREGVIMHVGSDNSTGKTVVGNDCQILGQSHVAHDCKIGDHVTLVHNAILAGHVEIADHATIGGVAAIHQNVRIGHHAFVGGMAGVAGDVIPYGIVMGNHAVLRGLNIVGMRRAGMKRDDIHAMRAAYRLVFSSDRTMAENIDRVREKFGSHTLVADMIDFLAERKNREFVLPSLAERRQFADGNEG